MSHRDEYDTAMLAAMNLIWGEGFMAPGGVGHVEKLVAGLALADQRLLDIGCGQGMPACLLAERHGARVVGTDLEHHLVRRSRSRAERLGVADRATFLTVQPGPLCFADGSFDVVISTGAFTQVEDKLGMFRECYRVLRPGGKLRCYDWMRSGDGYSDAMRRWLKLEGLTYAMETAAGQAALLTEAGFGDVQVMDASAWYRAAVRREYEALTGPLRQPLTALLGADQAVHFIDNWRASCDVCERGEMRQVYMRACRP
ncbi:methyltransferase domain-containing protein [Haliea sp. E1-2-M8]|uniref:class I SAM-dependent methyltransferase n=1 Tax=Haliea sp. E1-2-M8 TaxID=3064706 RepID=UPI00272156E8|nr:class I SAM-dependent methyltransferase [Haliea sp. E1-2-M8]MDO8860138.1 methyltransferase domain-containing protein [Haliea sp. E1-2-M8]